VQREEQVVLMEEMCDIGKKSSDIEEEVKKFSEDSEDSVEEDLAEQVEEESIEALEDLARCITNWFSKLPVDECGFCREGKEDL
jgi:hypothetical protein